MGTARIVRVKISFLRDNKTNVKRLRMAKLLVLKSNVPDADGSVIGVFENDHQFGRMESRRRFIEMGGTPADWNERFYNVTVHDCELDELSYLSECGDNGHINIVSLSHLPSSVINEINETGESTVTRDELSEALFKRGQ